jgi:hypothetical protein
VSWFALAILVFASAGLVFYQVATPLWLNRFQKQSAALIDTPNGAAALLLVAVAEVRGPISILERSIIERQLTSTLSLHADATAHLVDEAIEVVSTNPHPGHVLEEVSHILKHKFVNVERQQFITMAQRVSRAHDGPTLDQQQAIERLVTRLKILH